MKNDGVYRHIECIAKKTMSMPLPNDVTIYSGQSGIGLFFIYLYTMSKKPEYLSFALKINRNLEDIISKKTVYTQTLYSGDLSVCYFYLAMFLATKNANFYQQSMHTAVKILNHSDISPYAEFVHGISGVIFFLIMLYKIQPDMAIARYIEIYATEIIIRAIKLKNGMCWDPQPNQIQALCGFAHGASGVAFSLFALYEETRLAGIKRLAQQAILYEQDYYSEKYNNYPDFRMNIYDKSFLRLLTQAYKENLSNVFQKPEFKINAWCHGSQGILMNQMHYNRYISSNSKLLRKRVTQRVFSINNEKNRDISLCHGLAGNVEFLLEFQNTHKEISQPMMDSMISKLIKLSKACDENSLFLGNAGVGYTLLRSLCKERVPSLLIPRLNSRTTMHPLNISSEKISKALRMKFKEKDYDTPNRAYLYIQERINRTYFDQWSVNNLNQKLVTANGIMIERQGKLLVVIQFTSYGMKKYAKADLLLWVIVSFAQPQTIQTVIEGLDKGKYKKILTVIEFAVKNNLLIIQNG